MGWARFWITIDLNYSTHIIMKYMRVNRCLTPSRLAQNVVTSLLLHKGTRVEVFIHSLQYKHVNIVSFLLAVALDIN